MNMKKGGSLLPRAERPLLDPLCAVCGYFVQLVKAAEKAVLGNQPCYLQSQLTKSQNMKATAKMPASFTVNVD